MLSFVLVSVLPVAGAFRDCLLHWACRTFSFPTNVCIINGSQIGLMLKFYAQWRFSISFPEQSGCLGECVGGAHRSCFLSMFFPHFSAILFHLFDQNRSEALLPWNID